METDERAFLLNFVHVGIEDSAGASQQIRSASRHARFVNRTLRKAPVLIVLTRAE
jgi:hypothetical protein